MLQVSVGSNEHDQTTPGCCGCVVVAAGVVVVVIVIGVVVAVVAVVVVVAVVGVVCTVAVVLVVVAIDELLEVASVFVGMPVPPESSKRVHSQNGMLGIHIHLW